VANRTWLIVGAGALLIAGAGVTYVASTNSSSQSVASVKPSPTTPSPSPSITSNGNGNDPKAFDISAAASPNIAPGLTSTNIVTLKNNASQAIRVVTLNGAVAPVSGCDTSKITVVPYNKNDLGAVIYKVEGRATAQIPMKIVFTNTNTNQNGCKNKNLTINYTGTAEQW
jgi:hypothetical protein